MDENRRVMEQDVDDNTAAQMFALYHYYWRNNN